MDTPAPCYGVAAPSVVHAGLLFAALLFQTCLLDQLVLANMDTSAPDHGVPVPRMAHVVLLLATVLSQTWFLDQLVPAATVPPARYHGVASFRVALYNAGLVGVGARVSKALARVFQLLL